MLLIEAAALLLFRKAPRELSRLQSMAPPDEAASSAARRIAAELHYVNDLIRLLRFSRLGLMSRFRLLD